ncbi:cytochrome b/b6 domain-containing protein [Ignatzschineria cameli]|uniref:Cytochrome b561 bacterial/Ni-hydrogenase domain-containing protein n=1 Tax=Ignatzschineria cameli TaxID=2182793 RepID=A0A2U2AR18_9GAMM|nr:cytochrome b/b6 domain-containing protein [Ignatzschineria cameli]PWD86337.1 hypothetical protein DC077_06245 [Ignatzschineria cameli]PWD89825.1 hypothetical protein DC079_05685 [Ignatzschineria cameli]PWD91475.1 hypothetical protein DC081_05395 [Ignatzschineria cameli]PWD92513.1 hypothetical protein DC078_05680 [Ignatzschineria cameli]
MIKVWDLPTRLFHWILALAVLVCVYTSYNFSDYYDLSFLGSYSAMAIHQYAGTLILALLIFRLIWGIIGATTARFSNFIRGPFHIVQYLKKSVTPTEGHNPLGALMVVALILLLLIQVVTGLFLEDNTYMFANAPLAKLADSDMRSNMIAIHSNGRAILLWFIGLHITAVFAYLIVKRQNLIRTMITGTRDRSAAHTPNPESIKADRPLVGIALMIIIIALTFYLLF